MNLLTGPKKYRCDIHRAVFIEIKCFPLLIFEDIRVIIANRSCPRHIGHPIWAQQSIFSQMSCQLERICVCQLSERDRAWLVYNYIFINVYMCGLHFFIHLNKIAILVQILFSLFCLNIWVDVTSSRKTLLQASFFYWNFRCRKIWTD